MKSHVKSAHTKTRPTKCDICGKGFRLIELHKRRKHPTPDQLAACAVCGKKKADLPYHMLIVHGKETFPCPTCARSFKTKKYLKVHVDREHLGVRFPCLFCAHVARSRSNLIEHHGWMHSEQYAAHKRKKAGRGAK